MPPKTPASYRTIPQPDMVVEALRKHVAELDVRANDLHFTLDGWPDQSSGVRSQVAPGG